MSSYAYYQEVASRHPKLSQKEELVLIRTLSSGRGDAVAAAMDKLVRHHIWFVLLLVTRRANPNAWYFEDALSAGIDGLYTAVRRAKDRGAMDAGVLFRAFAKKHIHGRVMDALGRAPVVAVTKYGRTQGNKRRRAEERGEVLLDAPIPKCEIVSLDAVAPIDEEEAVNLHSLFADEGCGPADSAELRLDIQEALSRIPLAYRRVIEARYGLGCSDVRGKTQKDAATELGLLPQRLQQMEHLALQKLRSILLEDRERVA